MRTIALAVGLTAALISPLLAQRSDCKETRTPKQLPPAGALVDSAAALAELAAIDAPGGMLFTLIFREGDSLPRVRPLFETPPAAVAILVRRIAPQRPGQLWGVRVRVTQGPPASLQLERAVYCPPVVISESRPPAGLTMSGQVRAADVPRVNAMGQGTIESEVRVSEDGVPITINLVQASGVAEIDQQIVDRWRQTSFKPALIDGVAVQGWYKSGGKSPRL